MRSTAHHGNRQIVLLLLFLAWCQIAFSQDAANSGKQVFEYASPFYKMHLTNIPPFVKFLSVDSLGGGNLEGNPVQWRPLSDTAPYELRRPSDSEVEICANGVSGPVWKFILSERQFSIISHYKQGFISPAIDFRFGKQQNHATLLGLMGGRNKSRLPAVLHLPDMGSLQVTSEPADRIVDYAASRRAGENFISMAFPPASEEAKTVRYTFTVAAIHPIFDGVDDPRLAGFRRNYINLFQVNPSLQVIANNSCSDPCAFTLFLSSMLAPHTPPLVESLRALDLIRMSIERYLNGMKGYVLVAYTSNYEGTEAAGWSSPVNSLDAYPSLVITACSYIKGSGDLAWAERYYPQIKAWMDGQIKRDYDGNGLIEYELSGNSGSWDGVLRPANWWDTIGFGHEDAFSNALTYEALNLFSLIAGRLGKPEEAAHYQELAGKLKSIYFKTFYNPETGVLAGWKSKDGRLHDYYFLVVNSMAVYYGLVPEEAITPVMTALWNKMREVGFTDFSLGLPGNLVSVRREDYTHPDPRWGGGKNEDGSDAFQRYENGGASINWAYFTLKAFRKAGLDGPLQEITDGILQGIDAGDFQGSCENGMTKDWKTWTGECWGYEGYLCDGYLVLLALNPGAE